MRVTGVRVIARKEIAEFFAQKRNLVGMLFAPLLMIFIFLFVFPSLIDSLSKTVPASVLIPKVLDMYGFNYTLFLILMMQTALATDMFIAEKMRKSIEVTLTSPVSVNDILIGKVVATFAMAYPISVGSFFVVAVFFWSSYGLYLPSLPTLVYAVSVLPMLAILLFALLGLLQLSTRYYKAANAIFSFVIVLAIAIPSFFIKEMPTAQDLLLFYAVACAILGMVMSRLGQTLLDRERVVTTGG